MSNKDFAECRSCHAPIYWMTMKKSGKKCPVNAQRVTLRRARELYGEKIYFVVGDMGEVIKDLDTIGFLSHFATCLDANKFHKKK